MTREEAIWWVNHLFEIRKEEYFNKGIMEDAKEVEEAQHMAIEALQEPKTIIGIDIPYGSDKGIATVFKGKSDKLILEEVKEIMSVVRCKDCRHQDHCHKTVAHTKEHDGFREHWSETIEWCSRGERREE